MKKIFRTILTAAAGIILASACDICPQFDAQILSDSVSTAQDQVVLEAVSGSATFEVKSTGDWIIINNADWLTVYPMHGTGPQTITLVAKDNVDDVYGEVSGPRSEKISICGTDVTIPVTVSQKGEAGLDASRSYKKITSAEEFDPAKSFLIVSDYDGKYYAPKMSTATSTYYSYIYAIEVEPQNDVITMSDASKAYSAETVEGGIVLKQPDGTYLQQSKGYASFYAKTDIADATVWTVDFDEAGHVRLYSEELGGLYFSYDAKGYKEFAGYTPGDGYVMPYIYIDSKASTGEVLNVSDVTVDASACTATIPVVSNAATGWRVRCHDSWIKSYTSGGEGNGDIILNFEPNTSYDEDKVASVMVLGETTGITVKFTQSKFIPVFSVDPAAASVAADARTASFNVTANVPWTVECPAGVTADVVSGDADATVTLSFAENTSDDDLFYEVKVKAADTHLAAQELTVKITHKNAAGKAIPYAESFAETIGEFSIKDVTIPSGTTYIWKHSGNAAYGMKASAYFSKTAHESESWLVSPVIDLTEEKSAQVTFDICASSGVTGAYDDVCYGLVIDGENQTKVSLGFGPSYAGKYAWLSNKVDLSAFVGKKIKFAFVYKSTAANCPTLEVKNVAFDVKTNSFAEIVAAGAGTYNTKNVLVVAVGSTNTVLYDGTAYMFAYDKQKVCKEGDIVNLSGATTIYNGCPEWNNPAITKVSSGNAVTHPEPVNLNEAALSAYASAPKVVYGVAKGSKSGYYVTIGSQKINVYSNFTIADGDVTVYGYTIGYHSKNNYTLLVATSAE